jgi:hypothetical protein
MPVLSTLVDELTQTLPKIVSTHAHVAADYAIAGSFLAAGTWFWRRNREAGLGALICGGSALGLAVLTSYPGHKKRLISFPVHGKLEVGLAAMIATMPEFLRFEKNRGYFLTKAGILTAVSNMTCFAHPRHAR